MDVIKLINQSNKLDFTRKISFWGRNKLKFVVTTFLLVIDAFSFWGLYEAVCLKSAISSAVDISGTISKNKCNR